MSRTPAKLAKLAQELVPEQLAWRAAEAGASGIVRLLDAKSLFREATRGS